MRKYMWSYAKFEIILFLLLAASGLSAAGQQKVSVGFYNTENLFDTIPSPFYDDKDFTPSGRNQWNGERYDRKLRNLARVVDDAGFDLLGLAEVENEVVVRDLITVLADGYNYIHRTTSDSRGIDVAVIYKGDKFFPENICQISSGSSREFLHVRGSLAGDTVNIIVCHMPSKFNSPAYRKRAMGKLAFTADSLIKNDTAAKLIVMGDFNSEPAEKCFREAFGQQVEGLYSESGLYGALHDFEKRGFGSYCWDNKWMIYDNIIVSQDFLCGGGLRFLRGGVFVRDYLIAGGQDSALSGVRAGYPKRTFSSGHYTGGYSDHLPVFAVFVNECGL